jgi:NAD(P)H-binding
MNCDDVRRAVQGQDAVVVVLGIRENPLLVRLRGSGATPMNVRSACTQNVVEGMHKHGVRRVVVQTTYGVGETRDRLPAKWRIIFSLLLKPQIADTEKHERVVRDSGLDWTIVQPVGLTNDRDTKPVLVSTTGETRGMAVSRKSVARVLADTIEESKYVRKCIAVSE